ncbi:MAG: hypothetical protein J5682_09040 [Prevotella sp.]|nr:hypothetical protein [Prevotella sp.]
MKERLKFIPLAVVILVLVGIGVCLTVFEGDYLWNAQEQSLFLYDSAFSHQLMVVPAGFLSWLGTWFTQFFYHPWLGVTILCIWWAVLMALTAKVFRIPCKWAILLLIPVALLLLAIVGIDYWIYYLKLKGHLFVPTIGWTFALLIVWLFTVLPSKYCLRLIFIVLAALVAYPLMGWYGLAAIVLMGVLSWRLEGMTKVERMAATLLALLAVVGVPLLCYRYIYYETNIADMWYAGLPTFTITEHYDGYDYSYILLAIYYLVLACCYRQRPMDSGVRRTFVWSVAQCVLCVLMAWGVYTYCYKDVDFHQEMAMKRDMEQCDWNTIVERAQKVTEEPTRAMMMMKNLALFRLGRLGDEMYLFGNGNKRGNTPLPLRMMQVVGKSLYFHYGLPNFCYRWCVEDGVEYGWRVETLKLMTRCSIANGEYQLAQKYIDLLKKTHYHKEWAVSQEQLIAQPHSIKKDAVYASVLPLMGYDDSLNSDMSIVESFLMYHFANLNTDQPALQELSLVGALWTKKIPSFWPKFFQYLQLHPGQHVPLHYQEAAYLYTQLEHQVDPEKLPLDEIVLMTHKRFIERVQQYPGMSEQYLSEALKAEFGHTFYYEYFLNREQKSY